MMVAYRPRGQTGNRILPNMCMHLVSSVTLLTISRVGPETVTDPAFLVTRNMEDFITWVDSSKIRRKVLQYNDKLDDYDAMN